MIVYIKGVNRAEFCDVKKKKDLERVFFMTRHQLYLAMANGLSRMRVIEYGKERDTEAIICYKENEIVPYDTKLIEYNMDNFLAIIDRYKQMTDFSIFEKKRLFFTNNPRDIWNMLTKNGGFLIAGCVLLYAFLFGGH